MKAVHSDNAPKAVGPYSQAIEKGGFVFCSGQIGLDAEKGALVEGGVAVETEQVFKNLEAVLVAAECTLRDVVSTQVFLTRMEDFAAMNDVYSRFFNAEPLPARVTVCVAALPKGATVEISCIASRTV